MSLYFDTFKLCAPPNCFDAAKDVIDQAGDIGDAIKGKPRKGRKRGSKKASISVTPTPSSSASK